MITKISIDSYSVTDTIKAIADKNPDRETALAAGGRIIDGTRVFLQNVLEYDGADKQQGQVSISGDVQQQTHAQLIQQGYDVVAQGHQHLQKYHHAHDFSEQDKEAIAGQDPSVHLLLYNTGEGIVRVKAVDTAMNPVPFVVKGVSMDIIAILDNQVQEYREFA